MGACQVVGVTVVLYVMYTMWTSLLLLGMVVTAVLLIWRYVALRQQVILPAEGRVVLITGCDTGRNPPSVHRPYQMHVTEDLHTYAQS